MDNMSFQLERIADALESIAESLNQKYKPQKPIYQRKSVALAGNFITHSPITLEEELFILTTKVYLDETGRKAAKNMRRKSAKIVSKDLISMQIRFLEKYLPSYQIEEHKSGVLLISKDNTPKALIRFYTDLGFYRGTHWLNDINDIITMSYNLNISSENIFLIVLSNTNGLDNQHVRSTLKLGISNKDILEQSNFSTLQKYCRLYINSFANILPNPSKQIFFLASSFHPNVLANKIFNDNNVKINLKTHSWLSFPLKNIISYIQTI